MSYKSDYETYIGKREYCMANPMAGVFFHQERRYVEPFQIYGNVYYVGDDWVCVHLIDTGDGLLLIDSGNVGETAYLIQAIWEMGFRPNDVKWMILSHGHVDHIGGANFFRNMFGTKLYLGAPDAKMFSEHPEFAFVQDSPCLEEQLFTPDVCIHDGDVLRFGSLTVQCYLVPGHTEGCVALFFDATNGAETKRCGYYGGFGFNTMTCAALEEMGDPKYGMWQAYRDSIDKVIGQKVDIFLGNHTENNRTLEKRKQILEGAVSDPFIDPAEWSAYLAQKKADLEAFTQKELRAKRA